MLRVRFSLPKSLAAEKSVSWQYLDILHDALVNAWVNAGAESSQICGPDAKPWNFAALGWHHRKGNQAHSLVVSTPDPVLADYMPSLVPTAIRYHRALTLESVDFSAAVRHWEADPILPGQTLLGVVMLSPLAIRDYQQKGKRWHKDLTQFALSDAINRRLSRLAGREVLLKVEPDSLYLRCNPDHATLVPLKGMKNGKRAFVIGMKAPLLLQGTEADLRFAWYAGMGEKNRNGFGCIGLAEQGIGR